MANSDLTQPFWERKTLAQMTSSEWESLCDGCAKCCLHKLQDDETDEVFYTSVACRKLDLETCRCTVYRDRLKHVPECLDLIQEDLDALDWLPSSCAYRMVSEGRGLASWHPLVSGDADSVHKKGMSALGRVVSEDTVAEEELELYIIEEFSTEK
ncbi:MAG: YcgN family cysteine cluster protein [Oleiphilaceae bacterium]|nr:YcgN family cysteine cluster protein [Oleiphilaceae bacterium]